jgi:hypothetical protein
LPREEDEEEEDLPLPDLLLMERSSSLPRDELPLPLLLVEVERVPVFDLLLGI